jgi:hypothetical protein
MVRLAMIMSLFLLASCGTFEHRLGCAKKATLKERQACNQYFDEVDNTNAGWRYRHP